MKPATAWPPVPPTYSTEKVLKKGWGGCVHVWGVGGGLRKGAGRYRWLHQKGVTYEVTQNGFFGQLREEDEKAAFIFQPLLPGDRSTSGWRLSDVMVERSFTPDAIYGYPSHSMLVENRFKSE